jgi:ethanolamine-phosphate cytidylyltransferase
LNLHERVLSVLGCRYVDDVVIDAPYAITPEMIASLKLAEVIHGIGFEDLEYCSDMDDRYRHTKEAGIFHVIKSPNNFSLAKILKRISKNQELFQARFEKKMKAEAQHYTQKYGDSLSYDDCSSGSQ